MKKQVFFLMLLLSWLGMDAQITMPQPSPLSSVTQRIGLVEVGITYSRPSAKGRKVFGDLVPFDKMWRTGANKASRLSISDTVTISGNTLPKGDYALFTIPGKAEWTIIISKQAELSGTAGYKNEQDICRFKVKSFTTSFFTETFTIGFSNVTTKTADVEILWENTGLRFTIETNPDRLVMESINAALQIPANNYYQAASYYLENNKDLKQALTWINLAIENGYARYWVLRTKALIQVGNGDYKGAIETARKSSELAQKDGDESYVKMNDKSIIEWEKKK
ncbi:MAG: DUF2911 domain-containing protein [Flavobacteriales bacterium]|nr:DUF2911 domain-containing protein [Flavobacteriales bacterium]